MRASTVLLAAATMIGPVSSVLAQGPADQLLRLAPPDSGATLVVEDLRGRITEVLDSPLYRGLIDLPGVQAFRASSRFADLRRASADIERTLGVDLATIRDRLLGTAVVLSLVPGDGAPGGLLLVKVADRALLDRLIKAANDAEMGAVGPLLQVETRTHQGVSFRVRTFRPGTKPPEAYAILDGDIFAWSGTERLIRDAIERQRGPAPGLAADPRFLKVQQALPAGALASLYVDPRFVERAAVTPATQPKGERVAAAFRRYLGAMEYTGLALEWRDGPTFHQFETLDPAKLDEPVRRGGAAPGASPSLLARVPAGAVAVAATGVDWPAWVDAVASILEPTDVPRLDALLLIARGLLMGKDPRGEVLPKLGPGLVAYLDAPADGPWPVALAFEARPEVADAVDNALRTALAFAALVAGEGGGQVPKLVEETAGGVRSTRLVGGPRGVVYAMGPGVVALGNDLASATAFAVGTSRGSPSLESLRRARFPEARSFAAVDLIALGRWAGPRRDALGHRLGVDPADVGQALDAVGLLRAAYIAGEIGPGYAWVRRTAGVVGR